MFVAKRYKMARGISWEYQYVHMAIFRTTLPRNTSTLECFDDVDWFDNVTPKQRLDLWTTVTSVLCVGVNNPQNGKRHSGINFARIR